MGSIPDVSNNNNILRHTMGALRLYSLSTHTHIDIYLRIKSKGNVSLFPSSLCVAVSLGDEKEKKKEDIDRCLGAFTWQRSPRNWMAK